MTQNQALCTVEVVRLPAVEAGAADTISITADIPGGGAATAALPASSFAHGYSIWIEESTGLFADGQDARAYIVNVKVTKPVATNVVGLKAPNRELALAVQHELSKQIQAALRATHAPSQPPVAPVPPAQANAAPVDSFSRSWRRKRMTIGGVAAGGMVVVALVFAMGHRSTRSQQAEPTMQTEIAQSAALASPGFPGPLAQLMPIAPSGPEKDMDVTGNRLNDLDMGNLKVMGDKVGIPLREGEVPFYVLADPACAACRALEPIWTQAPARYKPIIIPVGFQTGGESLATAIQCSKDPVVAWKKTLAGDESLATKGKDCKEGATKVNAGNLFFHYLRLTGTPTIIAPNGVIAAGGDTAETLTAFLKQNEVAK
ncbi:hypothetical protein [Cupriavidus sp. TMH.W2]|uniref:hypothetical protein n=1 Tax=Cupriavidus sp. TMH.W2 TaxID=3434465 RepID=UPI003D783480